MRYIIMLVLECSMVHGAEACKTVLIMLVLEYHGARCRGRG